MAWLVKCLLEEVAPKTTLVLAFSTLQRKATTHRPQGAIPYLLATNLINHRLKAKKSFNCAMH